RLADNCAINPSRFHSRETIQVTTPFRHIYIIYIVSKSHPFIRTAVPGRSVPRGCAIKPTFLTRLPEGLGWRRSCCVYYLLPDLGSLASKLLQSRTMLCSFGGDGDDRRYADRIV